jgi:hypothetical protein
VSVTSWLSEPVNASNVELRAFQSSSRVGPTLLVDRLCRNSLSLTSRPESGSGSGRSKTAFSAENTAPFAPIPSASVSTTVVVNPGDRINERHA